ncbi:hypothetical protein [Streptomyces sp. NPDC058108]|uniref:hypothetical protein n=1 Tax=Streptomyces sp. NPDC058108 TaxID=3346344 RepID=UPI0036E4268C
MSRTVPGTVIEETALGLGPLDLADLLELPELPEFFCFLDFLDFPDFPWVTRPLPGTPFRTGTHEPRFPPPGESSWLLTPPPCWNRTHRLPSPRNLM